MKNLLYTLLAAALLLSCDKLPDDSLLDGMWQSSEISYNSMATDTSIRTYWSFRKNLLQFSNIVGKSYFAHTEHRGDSLLIYDLCFSSTNATEADNNEWITRQNASVLNPWGVYAVDANAEGTRLKAAFRIEKIDDDRLMLTSDSSIVVLRKF